MKEFNDILQIYDTIDKTTTKVVLATVIDVKGSSYRRTGARMLIQDTGIWTGGISGGCLEGDILKKAYLVMASNKPAQITYDTSSDKDQIGASLGCNGIIDILLCPINYSDTNNPIEQLRKILDQREPAMMVTVVEADKSTNLKAGQLIQYNAKIESLKKVVTESDINNVLQNQKSELKSYGQGKLFVEFVPPAIQLIIMGGNYDVYPLLKIAHELRWHTIVVTNPTRLDKGIRALASVVMADFDDIELDNYTVGILMSHDINTDLKNLTKALKSSLSYIGMLGPLSRKADLLAKVPSKLSIDDKLRLFGPAGLDIGASQPEEIAIAIIAEILSFIRNREGASLRLRKGAIYAD